MAKQRGTGLIRIRGQLLLHRLLVVGDQLKGRSCVRRLAAASGLCLAVAGSPVLGAEHTFDGVFSGKRILMKGSASPAEDDVSVTIHGDTLTFTDGALKKWTLDLPRFRGEMRAWDQALWLCVMLSSGFVAFFSSTPAELFFRPDPRTDGAAARSGGQGRPLAAAARRACP